jgi:putative membrane protein
MNQPALAVVLLLLGGITARICLTGDYLRYVKPGMLPLLVAAAVMLLAIGSATLWYHVRQRSRPDNHTDDGHHAHEPGVAWLLLIPVLVLAVLAPPAIGADAAARAGTALAEPAGDFPPLAEGDPTPLALRDYASRAVFDDGRTLGDRHIKLTGFVTIGPHGETILTRMILTCCAADARPIKVGLRGAVPTGITANTWLDAIGTYTPYRITDAVNSGIIPFLDATTVTETQQPDDPYAP